MKFSDVAKGFQLIEAENSRTAITTLLAQLFSHATVHEAQIISYLSLGLLRAPYEGSNFNFAEKNCAKVIAQILDISEHTLKERLKHSGDLGSLLLAGDWTPEKELTLVQVYEILTAFEKITGTGSQEEKSAALQDLLKKVDPLSACYIVRMMIGKLRLGFSDMTILDALSWSVTGDKSLSDVLEHAYNISADIGLIAALLKKDGITAIEKISITVGIPIRPAAAERLPTAAAIIEKIGPCIAQPKFDGFRLQVHLHKTAHQTKLRFFSRNLLDMSEMFPDLAQEIKRFHVHDLIVEGEALAYDEETDSYLPFQETVKRRRKHDIDQMAIDIPLKLVLFDILYLDGKSLLDVDQKHREIILRTLMKTQPTSLVSVTPEIHITTAHELENYFMSMVTAGLEGIMAKRPTALYQPGKRNFNWIKLKRQEKGHLEDTIDCVVLGYYYGKGKRASFGIGAFLVAVYNKHEDRFETCAKIGTGLSDEGWRDIRKKCDELKIAHPLVNMYVDKNLTPDVWVEPKIVVLVRADEITKSPIHTAGKTESKPGLALRFPRIMGYRPDKSAYDATEIAELRSLFNDQKK